MNCDGVYSSTETGLCWLDCLSWEVVRPLMVLRAHFQTSSWGCNREAPMQTAGARGLALSQMHPDLSRAVWLVPRARLRAHMRAQ